ncbi:hypothetical protein [Burkholderia gladioli]|uniref:hypothetical protein n=1 Tax=Burkholderia gladioli TaxID=28095 RepID=UPI001640068C|nr:hypothetical protein [Burkholderia gladioli]
MSILSDKVDVVALGDFLQGLMFWRRKPIEESAPDLSSDDAVAATPLPLRFPLAPPKADQHTLGFTVDYCSGKIGNVNLIANYLIGSRSNVTKAPRPDSDHDILIVLEDSYRDDIRTGSTRHEKFMRAFDFERRAKGVRYVDLVIQCESYFSAQIGISGTFANATQNGGVLLYT